MYKLSKEQFQQIGEYLQLSSEVVSDLMTEKDTLLREKEALQKQAEETESNSSVSDENIDEVVNKMHKAGFIKTSEVDTARESIPKQPMVLLDLVEKLADREIGDGVISLGNVENDASADVSSAGRKSDEVWKQIFLN